MSLRQAVHDDAIGFFHRVFDVFLPFADGRDGLVDDKAERMPMNEIEASHAGQYIERTVNRDGDDRKLQVVCQLKCAFAEESHVPGESSGAFGEDNERRSVLKRGARFVNGFFDGFRSGFVHENVARFFTSDSDERHLAQCFFHHPFEVTSKIAVNQENINRTLVVGDEDVALTRVEMLATFNVNGEEQNSQHHLRPDSPGIVAKDVGVDEAAEDGDERSQDGGNEDDG